MSSSGDARKLFCVGLTGGIGSGKTTVAKLFEQHGVFIIDTDEIAHQLTQAGGEAMNSIRDIFGEGYIAEDGSLNRVKMRGLIFSDVQAKRKLEAVLHPLILAHAQKQLPPAGSVSYVVMVVPLLLESAEFLRLVQRVLVVDCDEQQQIERVVQRSQLNANEVRAIMAQQMQRELRLSRANDVIYNNHDMANLARQVEVLHRVYFSAGMQNGN